MQGMFTLATLIAFLLGVMLAGQVRRFVPIIPSL